MWFRVQGLGFKGLESRRKSGQLKISGACLQLDHKSFVKIGNKSSRKTMLTLSGAAQIHQTLYQRLNNLKQGSPLFEAS